MAKRGSAKKYPILDYVNDYVDFAQTLVFEESVTLGQIVDRIQEEGYSVNAWAGDVAQCWVRAGNNVNRMLSFPIARHLERSGVLPNLVFLVDSTAQSAGPQTLYLREPLALGATARITELLGDDGQPPIGRDLLSLVQTSPTSLQIGLINLAGDRPAPGRLAVRAVPQGRYTGIVYASGGPSAEALATVVVYTDIDVDEVNHRVAVPAVPTTVKKSPAVDPSAAAAAAAGIASGGPARGRPAKKKKKK